MQGEADFNRRIEISEKDKKCPVYKILYNGSVHAMKFIPKAYMNNLKSQSKIKQSYKEVLKGLQNQIKICRELLERRKKGRQFKHLIKIVAVQQGKLDGKQGTLIIMEYGGFRSLQQLLTKNFPNCQNSPELALDILSQMLCALVELRQIGIIMHRDLKPHNIVAISNDLNQIQLKIIDFGTCSFQKFSEAKVGTQLYMSQQMYKRQKYTSKCDIGSLGIIIYLAMRGFIFESMSCPIQPFPLYKNIKNDLNTSDNPDRIFEEYFQRRQQWQKSQNEENLIILDNPKIKTDDVYHKKIHEVIRRQFIEMMMRGQKKRKSLEECLEILVQKQQILFKEDRLLLKNEVRDALTCLKRLEEGSLPKKRVREAVPTSIEEIEFQRQKQEK